MFHVTPAGAATPEFCQIIDDLSRAYPLAKPLSSTQLLIWARALADVPPADLQRACWAVVRESRYFPTVADIRSHVCASPDDSGLIAWAGLCRAARDVGGWASLDVEDGAAGEALLAVFGSWPEFCAAGEGPALGQRRQEFMAAYRDARRRRTPPARLQGRCEASGQYGTSHPSVWAATLRLDGSTATRREDEVPALPAPGARELPR